MMEERTVTYVGDGAYIVGVPARNLTAKEYEQHKAAIEACTAQLYVVPSVEKKKSASSKEAPADK